MANKVEIEDPIKKVYLSRTLREWKTLEKRMKDIGKKNLSAYVMGRIRILEKQYKDNPSGMVTSIPTRIQRPLLLPESYLDVIGVMSLKTNIPVSTLIDRLIIDPFLMPLD